MIRWKVCTNHFPNLNDIRLDPSMLFIIFVRNGPRVVLFDSKTLLSGTPSVRYLQGTYIKYMLTYPMSFDDGYSHAKI